MKESTPIDIGKNNSWPVMSSIFGPGGFGAGGEGPGGDGSGGGA